MATLAGGGSAGGSGSGPRLLLAVGTILFLGIPGHRQTFLARALANRVCQAAHRVVLTSDTCMLNEIASAELLGHLERTLRRY